MIRKSFALVSLSLGIVFISTLWSAVAQVTIPLPVPAKPQIQPQVQPRTPNIQPQVPLKPLNLGNNCTPRHACLGWDEQLWGQGGNPG
ncbi:MAG: murein transglycosylase, partial [Nodularia sp. (in: Bacteria)]